MASSIQALLWVATLAVSVGLIGCNANVDDGEELEAGESAQHQPFVYDFRFDARLFSDALVSQPVRLEGSLALANDPSTRNETSILWISYTIKLEADSVTGATGATIENKSPLELATPDPSWRDDRPGYGRRASGRVEFVVESKFSIPSHAQGTAVGGAVHEVGGKAFGAKAVLKLYPFCNPSLDQCELGTLSGIDYYHWGVGFSDDVVPALRLEPKSPFRITRRR